MGVQFKFKNMSLAAPSALPVPVDRKAALLALSGVQGLYLFEDGNVGDVYTIARDVSGKNNHAIVRPATSGFVVPVRTAEGILLPQGDSTHQGTVFDTPIPMSDMVGSTVFAVYKSLNTETTAGATTYVGLVDNSLRPQGNGTVLADASLSPFFGKQVFNVSGTSYDDMKTFDQAGNWYAAFGGRPSGPSASANNDTGKYVVASYRLDSVNKYTSFSRNGVVQDPLVALKAGFVTPVTQKGFFCFGNFKEYVVGAPTMGQPTGIMVAVVICNQFNTDAAVIAASANLTAIANKRGIQIG